MPQVYFNVTLREVTCTQSTLSNGVFNVTFSAKLAAPVGINNVNLGVYEAVTVSSVTGTASTIQTPCPSVPATWSGSLSAGNAYVVNVGNDQNQTNGIALSVQLIYTGVSHLYAWLVGNVLNLQWAPPNCGFKPPFYQIRLTTDPDGTGDANVGWQVVTTTNDRGCGFAVDPAILAGTSWKVTVIPCAVNSLGPAVSYTFNPTTNLPPS